MAKLNVTIPAVDVMVNGQAYRKVDRKAQAGDIVKALSTYTDIAAGAFYEVYADWNGVPSFRDDNNDERSVFLSWQDRYETYEPVTTKTPADPSGITSGAVINYSGDTYRKVDRSAREGDVIVFPEAPRSYLTSGNPYLVDEIDFAGDAQITDDDGDDLDTDGLAFDVYAIVSEEVAQIPTQPSAEYREVKRWAEKGERIRIVNLHPHEHHYEQGAEFTVNDTDGDGDVRVTCGERAHKLVALSEYVVLEPVTPTADTYVHNGVTYRKDSRVANVGELVLVVANTMSGNEHGYDIGAVTEIIGEHAGGRHGVQRRGSGTRREYLATADYVVLVPIPSAETAPTPLKYAAGDFVKVTGNSAHHDYAVDIVVKITETRDNARYGGQQFRAEKADGTRGNWLVTNDVEPADEAAFEAAKAELQKRVTVGDYVKVVREGGSHNYTVGSVVKVTRIDCGTLFYAEKPDGTVGNMLALKQTEPATEAEFLAQRNPAEPVRLKVGDFAKVLHKSSMHTEDYVSVGDIVKIAQDDDSRIPFRADVLEGRRAGWFTPDQLTQATPEEVAEAQRKIAVGPFTDGGFAVLHTIAPDASLSGFSAGDYVKVAGKGCGGRSALTVTNVGGSVGYCNADALRQITEAEYNAEVAKLTQPKAPEPKFSVGDLVKVTAAGTHFAKVGDTLRIFEFVDYGPNGIHCEKLDGYRPMCGFFYERELTKLSAEEVAAIEKEAQETAKWAEIGRKVGEFKRGDIVKIASSDSYNGVVGEIERVGESLIGVREFDGAYRGPQMKDAILIVPVELRFDTEQSAEQAAA